MVHPNIVVNIFSLVFHDFSDADFDVINIIIKSSQENWNNFFIDHIFCYERHDYRKGFESTNSKVSAFFVKIVVIDDGVDVHINPLIFEMLS
mgnify:CR=1 FL=1